MIDPTGIEPVDRRRGRRAFMAVLAGGLVCEPLAVDAQQPGRGYRSGYLGISCGIGSSGVPGERSESKPPARHGVRGFRPAGRCPLTTPTDSGRIAARWQGCCPRRAILGRNRRGLRRGLRSPTI